MLRSLVGSEMCIRDSYEAIDKSDGLYRGPVEKESRSQMNVVFRLKTPEICLLYTSDAADDLLCVDLGGRRIIKKKHSY